MINEQQKAAHISVYQFAINNVKRQLRSDENKEAIAMGEKTFCAFDAAEVLSIAFMKSYSDVLVDILG